MAYDVLIHTLMATNKHHAVKYVSPKHTIKATRRGKAKRDPAEFVVTDGRPNYAERRFIKRALKEGKRFPIKQIQLT